MALVDDEKLSEEQSSTATNELSQNPPATDEPTPANIEANSARYHDQYFRVFDLLSSLASTKKQSEANKSKEPKPEKVSILRSEKIPGHRGNDSVDELVAFINGSTSVNEKIPKKNNSKTKNIKNNDKN